MDSAPTFRCPFFDLVRGGRDGRRRFCLQRVNIVGDP